MISYIIGTVTYIAEGQIILENGGIGYSIMMPASSLSRISQGDSEIKVYTYMAVREDDVSLYGFLTRQEMEMYKLLITVSGVGPKGAIGILSSISVDDLKMAISAEDDRLISGAKGVGKKTAQKIVVELKGKIDKDFLSQSSSYSGIPSTGSSSHGSETAEAIDALEALGFSRTSAVRAVGQIENAGDMTASEIIGQALKVID